MAAVLKEADALKAEGNALFGAGDFEAAASKYSDALEAAVTVSKARPRAPPLPASAQRTATGAVYFASPLQARQWCQQNATAQQGRQD